MPAEVKICQKGPACWELEVKLRPRHNDPRYHEFCLFLKEKKLRVDKNYGWSGRGYHKLTVYVGSDKRAEETKLLIEEWGEINLPR